MRLPGKFPPSPVGTPLLLAAYVSSAGTVVSSAVRWQLNREQPADHRAYRLRRNLGRGCRRLEAKKLLPAEHLTEETKSLVSVSTAVVATVSALVLGLLISNANASFIRLGGQVTALSAEILRLDQILRRYGSDAHAARETLRQYAGQKAADLFPDNSANVRISALKPANPRDQWWMGQAMTLAAKIGDTRRLIAQQVGQGTPKAFIALLVFWLALAIC